VFAAMSAAEYGFQRPPPPYQCWQELCVNAFNDYVRRWNTSTCGGGLQWQFHLENAGFYYKNAISNGAFFQLSARLLRLTGNQTYLAWANKVYDWSTEIGLIDDKYNVFDGADDKINCTAINHEQWTYNIAIYLYGSAVMQNYTNGSSIWVRRTFGFLDATATFFSPFLNSSNVMFEAQCELSSTCNVDQVSMKAYLARWLADTSILAPFTAGRVGALLRASALGAAAACTAGPYGNTCGSKWYINNSDGTSGLGQQLSAAEVIYALLVNETEPPKTLSHIRTRDESRSAISLRLPQATPRSTAGPLYSANN
jgi:mannan endo-1,6-alpha-mannosidase